MMLKPLTFVIAATGGLSATAALAQECPDLGLPGAYLTAYFCGQLEDVMAGETTRTIGTDTTEVPEGPGYEWRDDPFLQEAWRVDPKKTLELIQRIRLAGGLQELAN